MLTMFSPKATQDSSCTKQNNESQMARRKGLALFSDWILYAFYLKCVTAGPYDIVLHFTAVVIVI